jgi:hypothetical protein
MQKVEGSSPFSRSQKSPPNRRVFCWVISSRCGKTKLGIRIGHQTGVWELAAVVCCLTARPCADTIGVASIHRAAQSAPLKVRDGLGYEELAERLCVSPSGYEWLSGDRLPVNLQGVGSPPPDGTSAPPPNAPSVTTTDTGHSACCSPSNPPINTNTGSCRVDRMNPPLELNRSSQRGVVGDS